MEHVRYDSYSNADDQLPSIIDSINDLIDERNKMEKQIEDLKYEVDALKDRLAEHVEAEK